eukprot:scpid96991/ scgid15296/ 
MSSTSPSKNAPADAAASAVVESTQGTARMSGAAEQRPASVNDLAAKLREAREKIKAVRVHLGLADEGKLRPFMKFMTQEQYDKFIHTLKVEHKENNAIAAQIERVNNDKQRLEEIIEKVATVNRKLRAAECAEPVGALSLLRGWSGPKPEERIADLQVEVRKSQEEHDTQKKIIADLTNRLAALEATYKELRQFA